MSSIVLLMVTFLVIVEAPDIRDVAADTPAGRPTAGYGAVPR